MSRHDIEVTGFRGWSDSRYEHAEYGRGEGRQQPRADHAYHEQLAIAKAIEKQEAAVAALYDGQRPQQRARYERFQEGQGQAQSHLRGRNRYEDDSRWDASDHYKPPAKPPSRPPAPVPYDCSGGSATTADERDWWEAGRYQSMGYKPPPAREPVGYPPLSQYGHEWKHKSTRRDSSPRVYARVRTPSPYGPYDDQQNCPPSLPYMTERREQDSEQSLAPLVSKEYGMIPVPPGAERSLWLTDPIFNFVFRELREKNGMPSACVASLCANARQSTMPRVADIIKTYDSKAKKRKKKAGLMEYLTEVHATRAATTLFTIRGYDLVFASFGF